MRLAIIKRVGKSGKPRYQVRIPTTDPLTGRRRNVTVGTYPTKREAEHEERSAVIQRDAGSLILPDKVTIAELLIPWIDIKANTITSNSLADYRSNFKRHILPAFGTMKVQQVAPARVQAQYAAWKEAGMSASMIRRCHMRLSQLLGYAVRMGIVLQNPCDAVTPPRVERPKFDYWRSDEVRRFLEAAEGDWLAPLWHLLIFEGMRRGEALGLRWSDLNWTTDENGEHVTAHIVQTVTTDKAGKGGAIIQPRTKTKAGARSVRLTSDTIAALNSHRRTWAAKKLKSSRWQDTDLVICTVDGGPINPTNVTRSFAAILKGVNGASEGSAKLRRIKVHELRHTSATLMLLANVPAKVVSERLGHASIAITLDLYSHVLPDMQDRAASEISRVIAYSKPATVA